MGIIVRDVKLADAEAIVGILNPIIAARIHTAFEAARQKGFEKIFTFVRADNTMALAAYTACGFRVIGTARRHAKIDGRYIDEVLIETQLQ